MNTFHDNPFLPPIHNAIIYILFTQNYDNYIIIIIRIIIIIETIIKIKRQESSIYNEVFE